MHIQILLGLFLGLTTWAAPVSPVYSRDGSIPSEVIARKLQERQNWNVVRNDLVDGICRPVTLIFARGTGDLGNVGLLVGPPLINNLGAIIGYNNVAAQGVDYPADIPGYLEGGSLSSGQTLASLAQLAATQCPSTQIVLGGYSQGAQVVYRGAADLTPDVAARVHAVVLFGNPDNGQPVPNIPADRTITYCTEGDLICAGEPIVLPAHLTYDADTPAAAQFIAARVTV